MSALPQNTKSYFKFRFNKSSFKNFDTHHHYNHRGMISLESLSDIYFFQLTDSNEQLIGWLCLLAQIIYIFRKLVMLGMSHLDLLTISITYVHLSVEIINIHKDYEKKKKTLLISTHQLIDLL